MQNTVRKGRRNQGHKRPRIYASSSITKIVYCLVVLFFINSCSHLNQSSQDKLFSNLCLSGEGKGRIEYLKRRYVFGYENKFNSSEEEWVMALSLPLHGEELLKLGFRDALKSKVKLKGKFASRMLHLARNAKKKEESRRLKKVLTKIASFLKVVNMARTNQSSCERGVCLKGTPNSFSYSKTDSGLDVNFEFDKDHQFLINARSNSTYYRKINFILKDMRTSVDARHPFALTLIHRECTEDPRLLK